MNTMSKQSAPMYVPWTALVFALLGMAWCGYIGFPTANVPLCETSGCALMGDGKIGPISLWWIGGVYFFSQCVLCLRGKRVAAWMFARLALFLDCILLLIMFFTGPCFNCLVAAVFFALSCFSLRPSAGGWFLESPPSPVLLPIWLGLFLGNAVAAINENIPYLTIGNSRTTEVRIYFSPSCAYCREALIAFGDSATLYPVRENDGDPEAVLRLRGLLQAEIPMAEAVARCLSPEEPIPPTTAAERFALSVQMLRNKTAVMRQGVRALPLILVNGMPAGPASVDGGTRPHSGPPASKVAEPPYGGMTFHGGSRSAGGDLPAGLPDGRVSIPSDIPPDTLPDILPDILNDASNLKTCGGGNIEPCPE